MWCARTIYAYSSGEHLSLAAAASRTHCAYICGVVAGYRAHPCDLRTITSKCVGKLRTFPPKAQRKPTNTYWRKHLKHSHAVLCVQSRVFLWVVWSHDIVRVAMRVQVCWSAGAQLNCNIGVIMRVRVSVCVCVVFAPRFCVVSRVHDSMRVHLVRRGERT